MQEFNNTEEIRKWLRGCPALKSTNRFGVDYLGKEATEYAIYASPSSITFHENVLGEIIPDEFQSLNFVFASKEAYGSDVQQNLANAGFYDEVVTWVIKQNFVKNFPRINEGKVKSIVPTLTAYVSEISSDTAKYQIQLKMTYRYTPI